MNDPYELLYDVFYGHMESSEDQIQEIPRDQGLDWYEYKIEHTVAAVDDGQSFTFQIPNGTILMSDSWNDWSGLSPIEPSTQCTKCRGYRTEMRKLFTNDYVHCFSCDGGTPTPKETNKMTPEEISKIKY